MFEKCKYFSFYHFYRTFQDERSHQQEECKPWTKKPPGSYWEIKSKGSNTIDQIWGCRDGYEVFKLTPQEQRCRKMLVTINAAIVGINPITTLSTSTSAPTDKVETESSSLLDKVLIIIIIIIIIVAIVVVIIVIYVCIYYKKKAIETQTNNPEEKEPLQNFSQIRVLQMLALHLTENLCCEDMKILLLRLPTSDSFNAYVSMSYKRHASQQTYIETFIEWRKKNPCVNLIEITNTLVNNGQTEITEAEQYKKLIRELEEEEMVVITEEKDNQL